MDDVRHEAAKAEAEVAGLRSALNSARARHFEQLHRSAYSQHVAEKAGSFIQIATSSGRFLNKEQCVSCICRPVFTVLLQLSKVRFATSWQRLVAVTIWTVICSIERDMP